MNHPDMLLDTTLLMARFREPPAPPGKRMRHRARRSRSEWSEAHEARRQLIIALWPVMSVKRIAQHLDITADAVLGQAKVAGLGSRAIAKEPAL